MDATRLARIAIIGTCGSGKTTLARSLSETLGCPRTELDVIWFGPNWTRRPVDQIRDEVKDAVTAPNWVIDGNYGLVRELIWGRATTVIWLNYSFARVGWQSVSRLVRSIATRQEFLGGNRYSLGGFILPNGILWWTFATFWKYRRLFPQLFAQPEFAHIQFLVFTNPKQTAKFLLDCAQRLSEHDPVDPLVPTDAATHRPN